MADVKVTAQPNSQNIEMIVSIKAPLHKVFDAYTNPDLLIKWWSQGDSFDIDYYDATSGGKWRFVSHDQHGNEFAFHGCIHEVNPNTRLIQTFEFEGLSESGHVALERAEFASKGDNETEIRITSTFQSVEDRDGMVASGMESGFRKSIDALDALLVS